MLPVLRGLVLIQLYEHQKEALRRLEKADNFALLAEMGTGKSCMTILDWLRRDDMNLLVIAPKGVYLNWRNEIEKFTTSEQRKNILIGHWVSGGNKEEKDQLRRILTVWPNMRRVFLVNVESLSTVAEAKKAVKTFLTSSSTMMVIDESTRIKNSNSKRTRTIVDLGEYASVKRILSGLPTPRSPMDLYSQFYFLDWRILGFRNFYSFRARHAILKRVVFGGRSVDTITGFQNLEELQEKVQKASFRVLKEDCLDLPPKIYTERHVELSAEQSRLYNELKKKATAELENGKFVTATTAMSILQRLHQITYGHVRNDLGELSLIDSTPREQALMEVLEETNGKVIIWANFRETIKRLRSLIVSEYGEESLVEYWGATKVENREIAKKRFQEDPTCRFFLGNPSTGGIGITLTAANTMVYYANSFDLEHRLQSEDRAHRAGLEHSVTYVDLVVKGTIDEKILNALRNKIDLATTITGESAREWVR